MRYFDLKFRKLCHYPLKPLQVAACYSIVWLWRYCGIYIGKKNIDDRRKKQVWPKVSVPTVSSQFSTLTFTQAYGPDFMPFLRRTDCHLLLFPSTILPLCGSIVHSSYTVKRVWSWQLTSMPM